MIAECTGEKLPGAHENYLSTVTKFGTLSIQRYRNGTYGFINFFIGGDRARFKLVRTYSSIGKHLDVTYMSWPRES